MSLAALIISMIALVVSVGQWILNGPWLVIGSRSAETGGRVCLILIAHNHGRLSATVRQWGWLIQGTLFSPIGWTSGPDLPRPIEGHDEAV